MPSKHTMALVLTEDLARRIRERAQADTISLSAVVRQALLRFFVTSNDTHSQHSDTPSVEDAQEKVA